MDTKMNTTTMTPAEMFRELLAGARARPLNALQAEFTTLRAGGMKHRETLASMIDWRRKAAASLLAGSGFVPRPIMALVGELTAEVEQLRGARTVAGVRP
jgi:hypothetical protein